MQKDSFFNDSRAHTLLERSASEVTKTNTYSNTNKCLKGIHLYFPAIIEINNRKINDQVLWSLYPCIRSHVCSYNPTFIWYSPLILFFSLHEWAKGEKVSSIWLCCSILVSYMNLGVWPTDNATRTRMAPRAYTTRCPTMWGSMGLP
jgi:hypothetical protein